MLAKLHMKHFSPSSAAQLTLRVLVITSILIVISSYANPTWFRASDSSRPVGIPSHFLAASANATNSFGLQREIFWQQLLHLFKANAPSCPQIQPTSSVNKTLFANKMMPSLPDLISLEEQDITHLRDTHSVYVSAITGNKAPRLVYNEGTQGIVTTASGTYLHILLVSIRMLRRTGCVLPVEVFVERPEDFKHPICGAQLPLLQANCYLFSDVIGDDLQDYGITTFQLKVFSILFSSFENVLFMDADNLAVDDPTPLLDLDKAPFQSHGLVAWPDFWVVTASPIYFDVSSQNQLSSTTRPSSESGQLLVSKKLHTPTLLLTAYYNFYGPTHYYPLLAQGGPGQGDKETYCAAARALKMSFYVVKEPVSEIGHKRGDDFRGVAMAQHNPIADHERVQKSSPKPNTTFVHHHNPKLDPNTIFDEDSPTRTMTGTWQRMWGGDVAKTKKRFGGIDMERRLWQELCIVACGVESDDSEKLAKNNCENCKDYTRTIFGREWAF